MRSMSQFGSKIFPPFVRYGDGKVPIWMFCAEGEMPCVKRIFCNGEALTLIINDGMAMARVRAYGFMLREVIRLQKSPV